MENLVLLVAIVPKGLQHNNIHGGGQWSGAGYEEGNLSRLIFDMSKVGVLSTRFDVFPFKPIAACTFLPRCFVCYLRSISAIQQISSWCFTYNLISFWRQTRAPATTVTIGQWEGQHAVVVRPFPAIKES